MRYYHLNWEMISMRDLLQTLHTCLGRAVPRWPAGVQRLCALACLGMSFFGAQAYAGVIGDPVSFNGHLYYLLDKSNWSDAEFEAVALGGHLATINDQAENDFVFNTFTAVVGDDAGLWIGFNDVAEEGTFVWTSAEPVSYTNWAPDEPNNHMGIEHYVHMLYKVDDRPDGSWNDAPDDGWGMTIYGVAEVVPEPATAVMWCLFGSLGWVVAQRHKRTRRSRACGERGGAGLLVLALFVCVAAPVNAQPGSPWPMTGQNAQRTGKSPYQGPLQGDLAWVASDGGVAPIVGQDAIYGNSAGGPLTAFHFDDFAGLGGGSVRWSSDLGHTEGLAVDANNVVFLGNRAFEVTGFQALVDGTSAWYVSTSAIPSEPAIDSAGAVFVTCAGQLIKFSPLGSVLWQVALPSGSLGAPAIGTDGSIYVCPDNYLYAFTPTGALKWRYQLNGRGYDPVVGAESVIVNTQNWSLHAVNPSTGRKRWSAPLGKSGNGFNVCRPAVNNASRMVFTMGTANFYAFDFDGKLKWKKAAGSSQGKPAIGADGTVYTGWNNTIHALRGDTGSTIWSRSGRGQWVYSPAIGADGTPYVDAGGLHAFRNDAVSHPTVKFLIATRYVAPDHTPVTYPEPIYVGEQMGVHVTGVQGGTHPVDHADFFADVNENGSIDVGVDVHLGTDSTPDEWGRYSLILTAGTDLFAGDHAVLGVAFDTQGAPMPSNVVSNQVKIMQVP